MSEYKSKLRKENIERERERDAEYYRKNRGSIRETKAKSYRKHLETNRQRRRARYSENREVEKGYQKEYYRKNRDRILAKASERRKKNRENLRAESREWRKNNPEYFVKYRKDNRNKAREYCHRRRVRKALNGEFVVLDKEIERIYSSRCVACDSDQSVSIDHVIPIARGGRHSIGNLQPLCASCNSSKGIKLMTEWLYVEELA